MTVRYGLKMWNKNTFSWLDFFSWITVRGHLPSPPPAFCPMNQGRHHCKPHPASSMDYRPLSTLLRSNFIRSTTISQWRSVFEPRHFIGTFFPLESCGRSCFPWFFFKPPTFSTTPHGPHVTDIYASKLQSATFCWRNQLGRPSAVSTLSTINQWWSVSEPRHFTGTFHLIVSHRFNLVLSFLFLSFRPSWDLRGPRLRPRYPHRPPLREPH